MSARDEMMKTLVDFTSFPGGVADEVLQTLTSAGYRILGPDEVEDVRRIVEIANRNEWSAEGDRLVRALGRKA